MQKRPSPCPPCLCGLPVWPGCQIWARPPFGKGPPHALSNAVGWPEMAHREGVPTTMPPLPLWERPDSLVNIVRGSTGRGLQIAILWVSACSVVWRSCLEPSRSVSCKSGLPLLSKDVACHSGPRKIRGQAPLPGVAGTGQGSGPPRRWSPARAPHLATVQGRTCG